MPLTISTPPVVHDTFVIERTYPSAPQRVFAAFADSAKKRRWFAEGKGHELQHYAMDFRVNGKEEARFRFDESTPISGMICVTDGTYLDIVQDSRVVMAATMTIGGRCISATLATFEFFPSGTGTRLLMTHQGAFFEGADGPEMRHHGWQTLLDRLGSEMGG
jgi:uncharacterized protein YndB with AHSA1/START domain